MNRFRKFMYARYGSDQLSMALIAISFIILVISMFMPNNWFGLVAYIPMIFSIYRTLSKNYTSRRAENAMFLKLWNPIMAGIHKIIVRMKGSKTHKFYTCPGCKQTIRVPKGKGNIEITCPKCKAHFVKKT